MKKILSIIFILIFIGGFGWFYIRANNLASNAEIITALISKNISTEVEIEGAVKLTILPLPHLEIDHLRAKRQLADGKGNLNIHAPKTHIYLNLIALLKGEYKVAKLIMQKGLINIKQQTAINMDDIFTNIDGEVIIKDSSLKIANTNYGIDKNFTKANLHIKQSENKIELNGNLQTNVNNYQLSYL